MADITIHDIIGALTAADRKMVELERRASKVTEDITHEWAVMREAKDRAESDRECWKVRSESMQTQRDEFAVALMSAPHTPECSSWERKGLPSFPCDCWKADRLSNARGILAAHDAKLTKPLVDALEELIEVADLRGDSELPHPANDAKLRTARMQSAWDDARAAIAPYKADCADEFPKPPELPPMFRRTLRGLVPPESLDIVQSSYAGGKRE